ncbi:hypothetical protein [Nocardia sp. CDC160]|uniref:hypothetical protein n=1 Tax=Nocardia sp. CDC160 TaxID=3112166 RepID=UPI002DBF354F|nr:hypothetical protein [Nocardia sp. CDC160]MEC3916231.1 hypothetical protein [Nocardia sp. CDC160]
MAGVTAGAGGGTAHAMPAELLQFRSPSGNIVCQFTTAIGGGDSVVCDIANYTYTPPPRPDWCTGGSWGSHIALNEGSAPAFGCGSVSVAADGLPTLYFNHSTTVGNLTCLSMPEGITCTDATTGHKFRIARESYELG